MENIHVALIQSSIFWKDQQKNIQHFTELITRVDDRCDLIILPEMFTTGFVTAPHSHATTMNGEVINWMKKTAKAKNTVLTGSVIIEENENFTNRLLWVTPEGIVDYYDKRHLFTFGGEDKNFCPGKENKIFTLKKFHFKPMICYDLRFPVWAKNQYCHEEGYAFDCLIYTANWPDSRRTVWKTLLQARAIENQCYVIGVNRVGSDGEGLNYAGDSRVINAKGEMLQFTENSSEEIRYATLNKDELCTFRKKFPIGPDWDNFTLDN